MMTRAWALLLLLAVAPGAAAAPEAMCRVEGGDYLPLYARDAAADRVRVKPFLLDSHAVTHAEYLDFVRACPEWRRSRVSRLLADANYLASRGDTQAEILLMAHRGGPLDEGLRGARAVPQREAGGDVKVGEVSHRSRIGMPRGQVNGSGQRVRSVSRVLCSAPPQFCATSQ